METSSPEKILIVGPSWVGDMVMAQSLFLSLKAQHPSCLIHVLAPSWSLPLLERMPEVAKAIVNPLAHGEFNLIKRYQLGNTLRDEGYDQAIVLPNSWKSVLIPFFANIPIRTGFVGECRWGLLNDVRKLDKQRLTMTVLRFVALALPKSQMNKAAQAPDFKFPDIANNPEGQQQVAKKFGLTLDKKVLALCPGAEYGPSKRWPAEHFAEVATAKLQQGWKVWLLGSEKDQETAIKIKDILSSSPSPVVRQAHHERNTSEHLNFDETPNNFHDFIGLTTLAEAVDLLSLADTVVANDSGLMHLAAALGKKVIAIYGSTPPEFAPPLSDKAHSVSLNLPCSPCKKRICPLYPVCHPQHTECLVGIKPTRILELIEG